MRIYSRVNRPIIVQPYDLAWPDLYAAEQERILGCLGAVVLLMEHIGSTAVPGLAAKPVIDIAVGVRTLDDAAGCITKLEGLGYTYEPSFEAAIPGRRFLWTGTPEVHTYHLHIAVPGSEVWEKPIRFRDYLRSHPDEARRYGALKQELAAQHKDDIDAYVRDKTAFVAAILAKARGESAP